MDRPLRTFIAIPLREATLKKLFQIQSYCKSPLYDVKWVKPSDMHITLRFLADLNPKKRKAIIENFPLFFKGIAPFNISIDHLGAFPGNERPKVIWAGITVNRVEIEQMATVVEINLCQLGIKKEANPFSAHITLGRIRTDQNIRKLSEKIKKWPLHTALMEKIDRVGYFESILASQGPIYRSLAECALLSS